METLVDFGSRGRKNERIKVAIVHPWFPEYRVAFFVELIRKARVKGIEIFIFYGETPPEWSARSDSTSSEYAQQLPTKFIPVFRRTIILKSLSNLRANGPYDLVVLEHAVRNLETYPLLLRRAKQPVAFWGHGKTYSSKVSPLQELIKSWLARQGVWFFAYTHGGAAAVSASGFPRERVTAILNAVKVEMRGLGQRQSTNSSRRMALYIGGLDGPKRIGFLIECGRLAHSLDPGFSLVIAGDGTGRHEVEAAAASYDWLSYVGRVVGKEKAALLSRADVLAIPGSIGLVAVDSFVAGVPIVTTTWPLHGPEFEYLVDGVNAVVVEDSADTYSRELVSVLNDSVRLSQLRDGCSAAAEKYTVEKMADRFLSGILGALAALWPEEDF